MQKQLYAFSLALLLSAPVAYSAENSPSEYKKQCCNPLIMKGDVIGLTNASIVAFVAGVPAQSLVDLYLGATCAATPNTLVRRDANGSAVFTALGIGANNGAIKAPSATEFYAGNGVGTPTVICGTSRGPSTTNNCTAVGTNCLVANTNTDNTAVGYNALAGNTDGNSNTALGSGALNANTEGSNNTAVGFNTLAENDSGGGNTAVGFVALRNNTGSNNTAVGTTALNNNTDGATNTAVGVQALFANETGNANVAVGYAALSSNKNSRNTGMGYQALNNNAIGNDNVAIGYNALLFAEGSNNIAIGSTAMSVSQNNTAAHRIGIGFAAQVYNQFGIAIGTSANTGGNAGIAIGLGSSTGVFPTSGDSAIAIGNSARAPGDQAIAIGAFANALNAADIYIGTGMTPGGSSDSIRIGTTSRHTQCFIQGIYNQNVALNTPVLIDVTGRLGTIFSSSKRYKKDIQNMDGLSSAIMQLRPVVFRYNQQKAHEPVQYGLIAEEVCEVMPELVVRKDNQVEGVAYQHLPVLMLNEMQKQQKKIDRLQDAVAQLHKMNELLVAKIQALEAQ
jgi:hypothetical protein